MTEKHSVKSQTTPQQRKLLFITWEATGNISQACRVAQVNRAVFYYWKPRFLASSYDGLEISESRAPHEPYQTPDDVVRQIIDIRRENPTFGKHQIAKILARANNFKPVVSPNTVRRILIEAGMWDNAKNKEVQAEISFNEQNPSGPTQRRVIQERYPQSMDIFSEQKIVHQRTDMI